MGVSHPLFVFLWREREKEREREFAVYVFVWMCVCISEHACVYAYGSQRSFQEPFTMFLEAGSVAHQVVRTVWSGTTRIFLSSSPRTGLRSLHCCDWLYILYYIVFSEFPLQLFKIKNKELPTLE